MHYWDVKCKSYFPSSDRIVNRQAVLSPPTEALGEGNERNGPGRSRCWRRSAVQAARSEADGAGRAQDGGGSPGRGIGYRMPRTLEIQAGAAASSPSLARSCLTKARTTFQLPLLRLFQTWENSES